jgi:acyl-CoA synthetase (NDP forming)
MHQQLKRLLAPQSIAVLGGDAATQVIRQCKALGFQGHLWPVHPKKSEILGLRCYEDLAALPSAPDATFIAIPARATVDVVRTLSGMGAAGAICYASGFAEVGGSGIELQQELVHAAGKMALLGPNCYGLLNYLDGVALWPDQHGGERIERGVAIITQSGNIGLNITMQRRHLPLAYMITVGNKAGDSLESIVEVLLNDPRVSAIGIHMEGLDDIPAFSRAAITALQRKVPLVVLKAGSSALGARTAMSHTSSLTGPDDLYDALFARFGIARVFDVSALLETCKFLHVHGAIPGKRIASASCSGGEASLIADLAQRHSLEMPALPASAREALEQVLGDGVTVANPLDYHTYIWGDLEASEACFKGFMSCNFDAHILVLDHPRADRCDAASWASTVQAFVSASKAQSSVACVLSSLPEGMPDAVATTLLAAGVSPMQGTADCMVAIASAAKIGIAQLQASDLEAILGVIDVGTGAVTMLDEVSSKTALAAHGLTIPAGRVCNAKDAIDAAQELGFPLVAKVVSNAIAHKTEVGAVHINLRDMDSLKAALAFMAHLGDLFLIEKMVQEVVAEIIVGVQRDAQFGMTLTLGSGGVLVELLQDSRTLLFPVTQDDVRAALMNLKCWPLLCGFRGKNAGDIAALVASVMSVVSYAESHNAEVTEIDVNPILVLRQGRGVLAVDALIRKTTPNSMQAFDA